MGGSGEDVDVDAIREDKNGVGSDGRLHEHRLLAGAARVAAGPAVVAGAVVGAAAGAAVGHAVRAGGDTTDSYWKENLPHQPYFNPAHDFEDYAVAFRLGREARHAFGATRFEEIEERLRAEWEQQKGASRLKWEQARESMRGAWERAGNGTPRSDG